jgi:hypothetical protein
MLGALRVGSSFDGLEQALGDNAAHRLPTAAKVRRVMPRDFPTLTPQSHEAAQSPADQRHFSMRKGSLSRFDALASELRHPARDTFDAPWRGYLPQHDIELRHDIDQRQSTEVLDGSRGNSL